jgi:hypothetical protein
MNNKTYILLMSEDKKNQKLAVDYSKYVEDYEDYDDGQIVRADQEKQSKDDEKKYWLCFECDDDNREGCNTYYSSLVFAATKEEAIKIYVKHEHYDDIYDDNDDIDDESNKKNDKFKKYMSRYDAILPDVYFEK